MKPFAQIAYEAFHGGLPPMPWAELPLCSQEKWHAAAGAALDAYQSTASEVRS